MIEEEVDESCEKSAVRPEIEVDFDNEAPETTEPQSSDEEDVVLFIEYKYCTICHIEQPLRCKHCK